MFLSSFYLPSFLSQLLGIWCLSATQKCSKPSSKRLLCKWTPFTINAFILNTQPKPCGEKKKKEGKWAKKTQPQTQVFKRQEC